MARQPSLVSVRKDFLMAIEGAASLATAVAAYTKRDHNSFRTNPLHSRQARRVVALSFLWLMAAWESFLGDSILRYLAGAKSPGGWAPDLALGPARSLRHAVAVMSGRPKVNPDTMYLNWTTGDALGRCKLYFAPGDRIGVLLRDYKSMLDDAAVIRNRVAHASPKSRAAFKGVAMRFRGQALYQSYSVGDLLLEPRPGFFPAAAPGGNVLESYWALFFHLCDQLVP
ncbi:MAG: hypothetical protein IT349_09200 [Candidatus Eisenbacteria bacterium]|nr:hypothetical protein [Candidatus Eisenbacteria bacterium]